MDFLRRLLGLQPTQEPEVDQAEATEPPDSSPGESPQAEEVAEAPISEALAADGRTRQLPPLDDVVPNSSEGARLQYGQRSHVGQVRDNNQDAMLSFTASMTNVGEEPNFGLFVVADGMGGHEHGEQASAVTTQIIARYVTNDIFLPLLNGEARDNAERPTMVEVLRHAVQKANDIVSERVPDGGTTVTAAAIMGNSAYIAHVGDSRAYLVSQDNIEQVTRDHSLVQRLIELDQLTPEDAIEHPQRNVLYRAIGQSDNLDVDAIIRQIPSGGFVLLCSDGLWNLVSKEEMHQIVLNNPENTQGACERMVNLANERGGSDNITVVLVQVPR